MISCYLCEKRYKKGEVFNAYLCCDCHNKTSFCLNCDKIMMKIFEYNNIFKCGNCRKITPAISKDLIEVTNEIDLNPFSNISGINTNINDGILTPQRNIINRNNNNNITDININSFMNSPSDYKLLKQLSGNKSNINTPSLKSPFMNSSNLDFNNNNFWNNDNGRINNNNNNKNNNKIDNNIDNNNSKWDSNISCFSDNDTKAKVKNEFHLVVNDRRKILVKNKPNIAEYFFKINDNK